MATDVEREIRELLAERANDVRSLHDVPTPVLRRSRRRRIGTALASTAVAAVLVAGAAVGTRAVFTANHPPNDVRPGVSGDGSFAVWPQTTREEARDAQRCADAGDPSCTWQLGVNEVVLRYAQNELGWDKVFFFVQGFSDDYEQLQAQPAEREIDIGLTDEVGPLTVRIAECLPPSERSTCRAAQLTVERVLRPDTSGIWLITDANEGTYEVPEGAPASPLPPPESPSAVPPMPRALEEFLDAFMDRRLRGSGAEAFLSKEGAADFRRARGGLSLYDYTAEPGTTFEVTDWGDETYVYRVVVRIHHPGSTVTQHETLRISKLSGHDEDPNVEFESEVVSAERNE